MRSMRSMRGGFIFRSLGPSLKVHHGQRLTSVHPAGSMRSMRSMRGGFIFRGRGPSMKDGWASTHTHRIGATLTVLASLMMKSTVFTQHVRDRTSTMSCTSSMHVPVCAHKEKSWNHTVLIRCIFLHIQSLRRWYPTVALTLVSFFVFENGARKWPAAAMICIIHHTACNQVFLTDENYSPSWTKPPSKRFYTCVHMYIYMVTYIHIYIHTHVYVYIYIYMYIYDTHRLKPETRTITAIGYGYS